MHFFISWKELEPFRFVAHSSPQACSPARIPSAEALNDSSHSLLNRNEEMSYNSHIVYRYLLLVALDIAMGYNWNTSGAKLNYPRFNYACAREIIQSKTKKTPTVMV